MRPLAAHEHAPNRGGAEWPAMLMLLSMVFLVALGYGAGLPLVQLYLLQYLGETSVAVLARNVGLLSGVYTLALFAFAPWWGRQSDQRGRAIVLASGFAVYLFGSAMAALAPSLLIVYAGRAIAGAGAAAIVPGAQAYVADFSDADARSRRFVLIGSASFGGFLAGPAFGSWLAGPVMGVGVGQMPSMINWPALAVAALGIPLLPLVPRYVVAKREHAAAVVAQGRMSPQRRHFVGASMLLAMLASFAAGTFEVGFNLFGGQTLALPSATIAVMFITCSIAMLGAQALLLLPVVRRHIEQRWVAAAFVGAAIALAFALRVPNALSLVLLVAVVATAVGMIGPVLSYELLERDRSAAGVLLARQASAGNLGQALGSIGAGSLFAWGSLVPFLGAAVALLIGAMIALGWWGPARDAELQRR